MELFTQIRDIKAKAAESEAMVRDITRDIKQVSFKASFYIPVGLFKLRKRNLTWPGGVETWNCVSKLNW